MRVSLALGIALATAGLGVALRMALPVTPVDAGFRDVVQHYRSLERP
ncbi:hypothetical protein [Methylobacterium organophilum]|uniref:Uncharacterized protein n=1 Tax=Methylobacterium organophilum TaxID=410 RepID=A0ABQ4TF67_METOR|nr:hypothetical protein [Methylobacterium organophilum]GJE29696.1 hypothetical protein LKMONMHP_4580 [Methylobacterium organophilum]